MYNFKLTTWILSREKIILTLLVRTARSVFGKSKIQRKALN